MNLKFKIIFLYCVKDRGNINKKLKVKKLNVNFFMWIKFYDYVFVYEFFFIEINKFI